MDQNVIAQDDFSNTCCLTWKKKCLKLEKRQANSEKARHALRQSVDLWESQYLKVEADNVALKKVCEDEKAKADKEREQKEKEYALRAALENELDALKIESESLKGEVQQLENRISEGEEEKTRLKELVENEKLRANAENKRADSEKKRAEAEGKKAKDALKKVNEDKKLADLERKHYDDNKVQLEALKTELAQVKVNFEEALKQLEVEKLRGESVEKTTELERNKADEALKEDKRVVNDENSSEEYSAQLEVLKAEMVQVKLNFEETKKQLDKEKIRADAEEKRAEAEKKNAELQRNKAHEALKEDKRVAKDENKSSEEYRAQLEILKAEIVQVKLNFEETKKQLDKEKTRADAEKKRADAEKKRAESVRKKANEVENKVKEDIRLADLERRKSEESRVQLGVLKAELVQVKTGLEETKKQLEKEKTRADAEKKRADAEKKRSESERKKANEAEKKVKVDTRLADVERKKSEESRVQFEVMKTETIQLKAVVEETKKQLEKEKMRADAEKKRAESERKKANEAVKKMKEDNRLVDVEKRKSKESTSQLEVLKTGTVGGKEHSEEKKVQLENESLKSRKRKNSGELAVIEGHDQSKLVELLHQEVDNNKHRIEEMQSIIVNLLSSKNSLTSPLFINNSESESSTIKLLRKKLKFEKMLVKHAKEVAELEVARNNILRYELAKFKQGILKFSEHLTILDNPAFRSDAGITGNGKLCSSPLKQKHSHEQPHPINLYSSQGLMGPCSTGDASHSKYSIRCSAPLHEGCSGETVSGINSKLERLHKGPNQKMTQSSAINSCSASFSDRPLVGSQEAFPIITSTNLSEENSNSEQFPFSSTDGLTPSFLPHSHTTKKNNEDDNKMKELPRTVGSIGKTCQAVIHNLSDLSLPEKGSVIPIRQGNLCIEDFRSSKRRKKNSKEHPTAECAFRTSSTESDMCKQAPQSKSSPAVKDGAWKDDINDFVSNPEFSGSCNGLNRFNIMNLLALDNEEDERSFRAAMERPMSPGLPVLDLKSLNTAVVSGCNNFLDNNFDGGRSNLQDNALKCGRLDVIEVEIDSNNNLKSSFVGNPTGQLQKSNDVTCPIRNLDCFEKADPSQMPDLGFCRDGELFPQMSDAVTIGRKSLGLHSDLPLTCTSLPRYVIVFPEIKDPASISRIFNAVGSMLQCTMTSSSNYVKESLIILAGDEGLSSKEKACTFVSAMLQKISEDAIRNSGCAMGSDFCQFNDTFSCNVNAVLSDTKMKNIMMELWNLSDLLEIVEDFLMNRRALLFDDASSNLSKNLSLYGNGGIPCAQEAPISLLVAGGALLATICASIDNIGFVCEVSCNILRTQMSNSTLVLIILHIFAHICGPRYFGEEYGLVVDVIKSLVVHLERLSSSYNIASCFPSLVEAPPKPWSCCNCPFLDDASSIDVVLSLLLKELHNSTINIKDQRNHSDSTNLSTSEGKMYEMDNLKDVQGSVCENFDIFSLLELVSGAMSWDWSFDNVVCPLFKMLESCAMECIAAAAIALLGQVGRIGVEAHGYDDAKIETLRNRLCGFLSQSATGDSGFLVQLASAVALSGLLPLSVEDLINSDSKMPAAAVSFKSWFSSLSDDQQSSCKIEFFNNLE